MKQLFAFAVLSLSVSICAAVESPKSVVESLLHKLLHESKYGRIGPNDGGQFKLLSPRLRQLVQVLECDAQQAGAMEPGLYSLPTSDQVFDRWDVPSVCRVTGGRTLGLTADVEVSCAWGPKTDHQSGHLQLHFLLAREDGSWLVHEVAHGAQEDSRSTSEITTTTFSERLKNSAHQSPHPEVCQKKYPDPSDGRLDEHVSNEQER